MHTDSSSGLRKAIADQCDLLGALTTNPMVALYPSPPALCYFTMDDIKVLLSLWYLHTCGVESMVIYDKHCIIKHIPCPNHCPLDVMIGKAKPSLITRDTLGETVG